MAWYTTGTIAVSGTTVTGTGTNWLDNKQSIGAGQALLIPGSGTVKMYEIASVTSATRLTLKTSPGTIAAGQAYAILSFYTDSVPDFARRLAAQLSYYQSQMDGWQQIMTGSGSITLTAPDNTTVTISSFAKLTSDVNSANSGLASALKNKGPLDVNSNLWSYANFAESCQYTLSGAYADMPEGIASLTGTLLSIKRQYAAGASLTQFLFDQSGYMYIRVGSFDANTNWTTVSWRGSTTNGWRKSYDEGSKPALTDLGGILPVANGGTGVNSLNALISAMGFSASGTGPAVMRLNFSGTTYKIMMGSTVVTTNSGSDATIGYPEAFSTRAISCVAVNGDTNNNDATGNVMLNGFGSGLTGFNVHVANRASVAQRINWIAIGI